MTDELARIERSLDRLALALDDGDDELAVLAATTLRTLLALAQRDTGEDPRFVALQARADALLARAPLRLRGTTAIFRLLETVRRGAW